MKLMLFSKHLGALSVAQAGRAMAELGFQGVDLTVRPGGHVLPENARAELPRAVRTLRDLGLEVPLITTGILSATDPYAADIFEAAGETGVPELKLGYWQYSAFGTFRQRMDEASRLLDGIEELALRTGVRAVIHTHSGDHMSALAPVVWYWIVDRDPSAIGAYADPAHMVVEGGLAGWRMGLDLLGERIVVVAFKDYVWQPEVGPSGKPRMVRVAKPLSEGMVPWPEVLACLRQVGFDGWISLHREYGNPDVEAVLADVGKDLAYLRPLLASPD
ncbi:MAG: sugar phosphate isomerase/epimerase [Anaerolineae bacterium]|nr:sugar phosphate isomerase/epimerase [Anaerolineae bacterium]